MGSWPIVHGCTPDPLSWLPRWCCKERGSLWLVLCSLGSQTLGPSRLTSGDPRHLPPPPPAPTCTHSLFPSHPGVTLLPGRSSAGRGLKPGRRGWGATKSIPKLWDLHLERPVRGARDASRASGGRSGPRSQVTWPSRELSRVWTRGRRRFCPDTPDCDPKGGARPGPLQLRAPPGTSAGRGIGVLPAPRLSSSAERHSAETFKSPPRDGGLEEAGKAAAAAAGGPGRARGSREDTHQRVLSWKCSSTA